MATQITLPAADLSTLLQKVEALTAQVQTIAVQLDAQRRSQLVVEELVQELAPVLNQAFKKVVNELAEVDGQFKAEELLFVVKRLLANSHRFNALLDQMESALDLLGEVGHLSKPVYQTALTTFDQLERKGYFVFAQESARVADRIVTEFSAEDVRALGDNIVGILSTVRNMTQPDLMALANRAADTLHDTEPAEGDSSMWALLREMNDPQVRRGLARMLRVVKSLAEQPESLRSN
jgi:uncharacterized protein YjgD (DUF1641 family)